MPTRMMRLAATSISLLIALSCVSSSRPHLAKNSASQGCPNKDGTSQSASVTCRAGFAPECGCAPDGRASCRCVEAPR